MASKSKSGKPWYSNAPGAGGKPTEKGKKRFPVINNPYKVVDEEAQTTKWYVRDNNARSGRRQVPAPTTVEKVGRRAHKKQDVGTDKDAKAKGVLRSMKERKDTQSKIKARRKSAPYAQTLEASDQIGSRGAKKLRKKKL